MSRRLASLCVITVLLVFTFSTLLKVQKVEAAGTIYIRADGSIDPPTAPISTSDNVTYNLTDNIMSDADGLVIERDNVTLDGADFVVEGNGTGIGVLLTFTINVTVRNMEIRSFEYGIYLAHHSNYSRIIENNITENGWGIMLISGSCHNVITGNNMTQNYGAGILYGDFSEDTTISYNYIAENSYGIFVGTSSNSTITNNKIDANIGCGIRVDLSSNISILQNNLTDNGFPVGQAISIWNSSNCDVQGNSIVGSGCGLFIEYGVAINVIQNEVSKNSGGVLFINSTNNSVAGNNFLNNTLQAYVINSTVTWNSAYPSGGNYWSDFNPPDVFSGSYQNETGSDRIGDTPYIIDASNADSYPLIYPYGYIPSPDFNNDGIIDIFDIVRMALAFGSMPGMPNWDPYVDLNQDGIIDIFDLVVVALRFGETV